MAYFSMVQEFVDKINLLISLVNQTDWYIDTVPKINKTKEELIEMFQQQLDKNEDINDTVLELHQLINTLEDEIKDKDRDIDDLHKDMISARNWSNKE